MWSLLVIMTHNSKLSYQAGTGPKLDSKMKRNVITISSKFRFQKNMLG